MYLYIYCLYNSEWKTQLNYFHLLFPFLHDIRAVTICSLSFPFFYLSNIFFVSKPLWLTMETKMIPIALTLFIILIILEWSHQHMFSLLWIDWLNYNYNKFCLLCRAMELLNQLLPRQIMSIFLQVCPHPSW